MAFCQKRNWLTDEPMVFVEPRRVERDETKAIPLEALEQLWCRRDIDLREKTLWRMLYETAGWASEVLAVNIGDLDLSHKRVTIIGKGGYRQRILWASGTVRLLSRYLAGYRRGPVFLTHRKPQALLPARDLCPETGLARLTYHRAARMFKHPSAQTEAGNQVGGWTLHQLRHSCLTHLAQESVNTALLQAKSRHHDRRTLDRYTRPGEDAVAKVTARLDGLIP